MCIVQIYQQLIMRRYISFGQPGGGASRCPLSTTLIACNSIRIMMVYVLHCLPQCFVYLNVCVSLKRFVSETPYFVHETPKTPHITGCRVLLIVESLGTSYVVIQNQLSRCIPLELSILLGSDLPETHSRSHPSLSSIQNHLSAQEKNICV